MEVLNRLTKKEKIEALKKLLSFTPQLGIKYKGLCGIIFGNMFEIREYRYLYRILEKEATSKGVELQEGYLWKRGAKAPRVRFIKEKLAELRRGLKN